VLPVAVHSSPKPLSFATDAIGRTPLWLGPEYHGRRPAIEVGTQGAKARTGATLQPVRFVRFDYGSVDLEEFGASRPFFFEHGPPPGTVLVGLDDPTAVSRDGVLVLANNVNGPVQAPALAKGLRPVPTG
jgi:hypothetical protein